MKPAVSTLLLILASASLIAQNKPCPTIEAKVADVRFAPGQVWRYQTRPGEAASTFTILQVDRVEKIGIIIHIRVDGLEAHNPRGEVVPSVQHMPFTRDAILLSATQLIRTEHSLPTLEGYERWRSDCGGVYTLSVADAVDVMENTLKSASTSPR